jgi:hypothetical protein
VACSASIKYEGKLLARVMGARPVEYATVGASTGSQEEQEWVPQSSDMKGLLAVARTAMYSSLS